MEMTTLIFFKKRCNPHINFFEYLNEVQDMIAYSPNHRDLDSEVYSKLNYFNFSKFDDH